MSTKKSTAAVVATAGVSYRDKTHTSRSLILGKRVLQVKAGRLEVAPDDTEALDYVNARTDFERLTPPVE